MGTIWMTHQTRGPNFWKRGSWYYNTKPLKTNIAILQLQEATESDNTRVESIAIGTLKMQRVQSEQEVVIFE